MLLRGAVAVFNGSASLFERYERLRHIFYNLTIKFFVRK